MRRTSRTLPIVLAGSDFVFSGFGFIQRYDNMFGPQQLQRRGHRRLPGHAAGLGDRRWPAHRPGRSGWPSRAPRGRRGVPRRLPVPRPGRLLATTTWTGPSTPPGPRTWGRPTPWPCSSAARAITPRGLTVVDIVAALDETGFGDGGRAGPRHDPGQARRGLPADVGHLRRAAAVLSLVTDPNDYAGPGTGLRAVRQPGRPRSTRSARREAWRTWRRAQPPLAVRRPARLGRGRPSAGDERPRRGHRRVSRRVGVGRLADPVRSARCWTSSASCWPAWRRKGCVGRVVRFTDTVDLGQIGLAAARLSGSGIGIGLQGKGTALIHRRDLAPLANLELYSVAPVGDARALPAARRERRPPRQGGHPRPGPQPLHRRGHRGALPHHGDRPDGPGARLRRCRARRRASCRWRGCCEQPRPGRCPAGRWTT